jgi:hypothetical protein
MAGWTRTTNARHGSESDPSADSLRKVNQWSRKEKEAFYRFLIPSRIFADFDIPTDADGTGQVRFFCPRELGLLRIEVRRHPADQDCVFFLEAVDTPYQQVELSFCAINSLCGDRFDVDRDARGRENCLATLWRNIPEELRAMRAGLCPHQVRFGLGLFGDFFHRFEALVARLGVDTIVAEALSYHNAIHYERLGFDYITGKQFMVGIDQGFRADGIFTRRLDGSTPFRMAGAERTVRGRSWAIHDGILQAPWRDIRIYKTVGFDAGVNTFPGQEW